MNLKSIKEKYLPIVEAKREQWKKTHDSDFFSLQTRMVLRNVGIIDESSIEEYIATDGYFGFEKALKMQPQEIIDLLKASGQRGRGGAGFPTGNKWQFVAVEKSDIKYVVCNADEGDPGAFMDREILQYNPHSVLEAMLIAAYAVGAKKGFVYVRAEYPDAVKSITKAIADAKKYKFLNGIDIEVRLGAGAFVCGEETALISSIEGDRGMPRVKPPFPSSKGLWGQPTLINNVETLSAIPQIVLNGPQIWNTIGLPTCAGTKVFALAGDVVNSGLVEVPMGTTVDYLINTIGGGAPNGETVKAVQTGGPSGGCVPSRLFNMKLDFDSVKAEGLILGSGGLIVMDSKKCMVDVAKFFVKFSVDESCGKCVPCRIGNRKLLNLLEDISAGKMNNEKQLEDLEQFCRTICDTSLCGLGQASPNPVLSTMKFFREEYLEHVTKHRCPAGVCKALKTYVVNPDLCIGCSICEKTCPVGAISGQLRGKYVIDRQKCAKCDACVSKCPKKAIMLEQEVKND